MNKTLVKKFLQPDIHSSRSIWMVLMVLVIAVTVVVPEFVKSHNLANVLIQMVPLGIIALGQMFVILGGGIDLSVGSQLSLITLIASRTMNDNAYSIIGSVVLCLGAGVGFGLLNGTLVQKINIPPLIVTLCTGFIFQGIAFALHETTGGYIPESFQRILTASWGILSVPFLIFVICVVLSFIVLYRRRFGRYVYALGGNEEVLANAGIAVGKIKITTYLLCGCLVALAGIYLAARVRSGSALYGVPFTLNSVTAVVVGGTPLSGGMGGLGGTIAGVIIVSMLNNVLNLISFRFELQSSYYKEILTGIILVIAMLFYRKRNS